MLKNFTFRSAIQFLVLVCLFSCNGGAKEIDWNQKFDDAGVMGNSYKAFSTKKCLGRCQWSRVSNSTLLFTGFIGPESLEELERKIDDNVVEIWLNSGGGIVGSALKIAAEIKKRKINIVVKGFCISSCANYLFLAGERKTIEGVVGFHGGIQAMWEKIPCENLSEAKCIVRKENSDKEKAFFRSVGVDEILFEVTQSVDKGMLTGESVAYYAPSAKILGMLGVKGIRGDQNPIYLAHMKHFYKISGELEFAVATDPNPTILKYLQVRKP